MNASGQVLAGVRRAPAHGAVLLFCCHRPFHPGISKPLAGRGLLVLTPAPWGWGGRFPPALLREFAWRTEPRPRSPRPASAGQPLALSGPQFPQWRTAEGCYPMAEVPPSSEPESSPQVASRLEPGRGPHTDSAGVLAGRTLAQHLNLHALICKVDSESLPMKSY